MTGAFTGSRDRIALLLVVAALLVRLLIPAGWMPAAAGGFSITVCTGMGENRQVWIAADGSVHDQAPVDARSDQPCIFAGMAAALDVPLATALPLVIAVATAAPVALHHAVAVGRGLAAPPPPATGPPAAF
jgi:hypothetical protein